MSDEPVAWITPDGEGFRMRFEPPVNDVPLGWTPLYTKPEPAIRKPMTDGDLLREWQRHFYNDAWDAFEAGIRFAEKHHGISEE